MRLMLSRRKSPPNIKTALYSTIIWLFMTGQKFDFSNLVSSNRGLSHLSISLEKLIQICLNKSRAFHLVKYLCCKEEALKGPKPFESKRQLILVKSLVRPIPQQFHQFHSSPRPSCSIPQLIIDQVHTFKLLFFCVGYGWLINKLGELSLQHIR